MGDYKKKKEEYFSKVRDHFDIFQELVKDKKENPNAELLVLPTTEEEVDLADSIFTFILDSLSFAGYVAEGNLKERDLNENYAFNLFKNIINALKDDNKREIENIKNYLTNKVSPKEGAQLIFDLLSCLNYLQNEFIDSLCKQTGFDSSDELSFLQFRFYLDKANEISNSGVGKIDFNHLDLKDKEKTNMTIECAKEFHNLVEKEMNKEKELKRNI